MLKPVPKFIQSTIIYGKPGYLSKKLKTLTSSNYHKVKYFFAEILHTFPT